MKVTISYKNIESTEALEAVTRRKSDKVTKLMDQAMNLHWTFSVEHGEHVAHGHLSGPQMDFFAEATTGSIYESIDEVVARLVRQVRKRKETWKDYKHIKRAS